MSISNLPIPSTNGTSSNSSLIPPPSALPDSSFFSHPTPQTGPKTLAGKTHSRANAVKHGNTATDDVFIASLSSTERTGYLKIRHALNRFYQPASNYEHLLVDQMAIQHLRMLRLYKLESVSMEILPIDKGSNRSIFPHLDRLSRYDVRIEKQLRILHNRMIRLAIMREKNEINPLPTQE